MEGPAPATRTLMAPMSPTALRRSLSGGNSEQAQIRPCGLLGAKNDSFARPGEPFMLLGPRAPLSGSGREQVHRGMICEKLGESRAGLSA